MRRYWRSHAPTESLLASSQGAASTSRSQIDRKSTRLNSSHSQISYAVFCLKKKKKITVLVAFTVSDEQLGFRMNLSIPNVQQVALRNSSRLANPIVGAGPHTVYRSRTSDHD